MVVGVSNVPIACENAEPRHGTISDSYEHLPTIILDMLNILAHVKYLQIESMDGTSIELASMQLIICDLIAIFALSFKQSSDIMDSCRNEYRRLVHDGAKMTPVTRISSYSITHSSTNDVHTVSMSSSQFRWRCPIHGHGCMGHVESTSDQNTMLLPCTMIPSSTDNMNEYEMYKRRVDRGTISSAEYKKISSKFLMGKRGCIRTMNRTVVDGSMKMVISPGTYSNQSRVVIPSSIASAILIPKIVDGVVRLETLIEGDYAVLVRQPVLWSGGIMPIKVEISQPHIVETVLGPVDVNRSMKIPLRLCSPYAADFDGDEMSLFPVKDPKSIDECNSFKWTFDSPDINVLYDQVVPRGRMQVGSKFNTMSICTTTCWTDGNKRLKLSQAHSVLSVKVKQFISYRKPHENIDSFICTATSAMKTASSKSAVASDIGYLSRRAKLYAEHIISRGNGHPHVVQRSTYMPCHTMPNPRMFSDRSHFGSPSIRAVSKLISAAMQVTIKVKSADSVSSTSPSLTVFNGGSEYIMIRTDGTVINTSDVDQDLVDISVTTSLSQISSLTDTLQKDRLCRELVRLMCVECNRRLDHSEFEHMKALILFTTDTLDTGSSCLSYNTLANHAYPDVRTIVYFNACYYNISRDPGHDTWIRPCTLVEFMMLCNTHDMVSISDV